MNSVWNLAIDLDEYLVIKQDNIYSLIDLIQYFQDKKIICAAFTRYMFSYQRCWDSGNLKERLKSNRSILDSMVIKKRKKVNEDKIMFKTNQGIEWVGIHRASASKRVNTGVAYLAHIRSFYQNGRCSIIINESNIDNHPNMSRSKYCVDNFNRNFPDRPINITNIEENWKCKSSDYI